LQDHLHFIAEEEQKPGSTAFSVGVSLALHAAVLLFFAVYRPPVAVEAKEELVRFVEILRQQQPTFTEAPGPQLDAAPAVTAPFSDANRRASAPQPTGDQPTTRPGDGRGMYVPGDPRPRAQQPPAGAQAPILPPQQASEETRAEESSASLTYQVPVNKAAAGAVNWNSAIREVGKVASLGGDGLGAAGGEAGYAESGPISFETQWYEWGDYAQHMVARIRHNWYSNMPSIIRLGVRGVVTIEFTIQRSGAVTDVRIVKTSEIPPFDLAAKKAIELSSPLNPLPADFPNRSERVTAQFFYNMSPPDRR
jgi:TonB family protein